MFENYSKLEPDASDLVRHAGMVRRLFCLAVESMGDRIRFLRQARGLTLVALQERLAKRGVKVSVSAISQWEIGPSKNIKLVTVLALVDELGTSLEYLVHGPSDPKSRDTSGKFRTRKPAADSDSTA